MIRIEFTDSQKISVEELQVKLRHVELDLQKVQSKRDQILRQLERAQEAHFIQSYGRSTEATRQGYIERLDSQVVSGSGERHIVKIRNCCVRSLS